MATAEDLEMEELKQRMRELEAKRQAREPEPTDAQPPADDEEERVPEEMRVRLRRPVKWGTKQVEELVLRPTSRAMRGFVLKLGKDESISYEPYEVAKVGIRMAGYNEAQVQALLDRLSAADTMEVATAALVFIGHGPGTGTES
jgi:hypothetical protein